MNENEKNEGLSAFEAEKIRSKYTELIQNVIDANLSLPEEIKDFILDCNNIEDIMIHFDCWFLVHEFGLELSDFPTEFQSACNKLHNEFQKDFPNASILDTTKKNKCYGMNYRSPLHLVYFLAEYDDVRDIIRDVIVTLVNLIYNKKGIECKNFPYIVKAENIRSKNGYVLELRIYKNKINKYPCVLNSIEYSEPLDNKILAIIESSYEQLAINHAWTNEIDYSWINFSKRELLGLIPDFNHLPDNENIYFFKVIDMPGRYSKIIFSDEIDMANINTDYGRFFDIDESILKSIRKKEYTEEEIEINRKEFEEFFGEDDDELPF
jgi:hypothetical protein